MLLDLEGSLREIQFMLLRLSSICHMAAQSGSDQHERFNPIAGDLLVVLDALEIAQESVELVQDRRRLELRQVRHKHKRENFKHAKKRGKTAATAQAPDNA